MNNTDWLDDSSGKVELFCDIVFIIMLLIYIGCAVCQAGKETGKGG
jgi:hypothetical protein